METSFERKQQQLESDADFALTLQMTEVQEATMNDTVVAQSIQEQLQSSPMDETDGCATASVINVDDDDDDSVAARHSLMASDAEIAARLQRQFDNERREQRAAGGSHSRSAHGSHPRPGPSHPQQPSSGPRSSDRPLINIATRNVSRTPRWVNANDEPVEMSPSDPLGAMFAPGGLINMRVSGGVGSRIQIRNGPGGQNIVIRGGAARNGDDYDALWDLADRVGDARPRGLNSDEIQVLPTTRFKPPSTSGSAASASSGSSSSKPATDSTADTPESECRVCLSQFEANETLRMLPCLHRFHRDCIDEWIKRNAVCPICRVVLREQIRNH